jgi:hypothetical protein
LSVCALGLIATAKTNDMGIKEVRRVTFSETIRVGTDVLKPGEYVVRHTMEGQDHVMVFQRVSTKEEFKVKCTLVPLAQKAQQDQSISQVNSANEKVLQELVFRGDTAKHVF